MATLNELEEKIATTLSDYIYPNNIFSPDASLIGENVKICRGWPQESELGDDMMSSPGTSWIVVNQKSGSLKNTTRYMMRWNILDNNIDFGINFVITNGPSNKITIEGTANYSGIAFLVVDGTYYSTRVETGQNYEKIIDNIYNLIEESISSDIYFDGSYIYIPESSVVYGKCIKDYTLYKEDSRSTISLKTSIFSPSIFQRDKIENCVLNALLTSEYFSTPGFDRGALTLANREINDTNLNPNAYNIDLIWNIEFSHLEYMTTPAVIQLDETINNSITIKTG